MKLRYIFATLLAALTVFAGCEVEPDHFLEEVQVTSSYLGFPAEGGSLNVDVTAIDSWTVKDLPDWITASPASGSAGTTTVNFTASAATESREETFSIECGGKAQTMTAKQVTAKVEPKISTCAEVIEAGAGTFRVKGTVIKITNTGYGNWWINDGTAEGDGIQVYGTLDKKGNTWDKDPLHEHINCASNPDAWELGVGDVVTVEGPFKWYGTTPEFENATIIAIERSLIKIADFEFKELPAADTTFNLVVEAKESPVLVQSDSEWLQVVGVNKDGSYMLHADANVYSAKRKANVTVKGPTAIASVEITQAGAPATGASVSEIIAAADNSEVETLPNSVVIALTSKGAVLSDGAKAIYVYDAKAAELAIGDGVRINATKTTYNGVPELKDVTAVFVDSQNNAFENPAAVDVTPDAGTYTASEAEYIKLTGTLSINKEKGYYNLALDAFEDGSKQGSISAPAASLNADSFEGKKITVTGWFNGLSGGGKFINVIATRIDEFADNPKGTLTNPYAPSEIASLIMGGTVPEEEVYVKGKVSAVLYDYSTYNGTGTFWLSDDGTANGISDDKTNTTEPTKDFECYNVYWFDNTEWTEGKAQVVVGDEVVLVGKVCYYEKGNVAETVSKKSHLYSVNGALTDANGLGNTVAPFNVAGAVAFIDAMQEAMAAAKAAGEPDPAFPDVCVKGKVSAILYTFSADYGTGTFWISDDGTAYGVSDDKKTTTQPTKDFECYGVWWHGLENKWVEGNPQVAIGDDVVVKGQLTYYAAKGIYETNNKQAWLYSLNGVTE